MRHVRVTNERTGALLGERVAVADGWWGRLRGLLGRPAPGAGEGLLLVPCRAVHMHGMRYPLDVVLLDGRGEVVAAYERLAPGARTRWHRDAWQTLELPAGTLAATGTTLGDTMAIAPATAASRGDAGRPAAEAAA
jgi:uncharacterized membrane protein (UPF0127 family)